MKRLSLILVSLLFVFIALNLQAQGVVAGTVISNSVIVTADSLPQQGLRASTEFTVAEVLNLDLISLDSQEVTVPSPANNRLLSFQLTNSGNGSEAFLLSTNSTLTGDHFDPIVTSIWIESNNLQGLQQSVTTNNELDKQYGINGEKILLQPDQSVIIYVLSNIPDRLQRSTTGKVMLRATSTSVGVNDHIAGESIASVGDNGVELVLLKDHGQDEAVGTYITTALNLSMEKSVLSIIDPYGKNRIMSGSTVTYKISLNAVGDGMTENLIITDPTPEHTHYKAGSMKLNNKALSDANDSDQGDFNISNVDTATLVIGQMRASDHYEFLLSYIID